MQRIKLKVKLLGLAIFFFYSSQHSQARAIQPDTTQFYSFHINYWFNLHHFLWLEAFLNAQADSSILQNQLPEDARSTLNIALKFYSDKMIEKDLRTSKYMTDFKIWVTKQNHTLVDIPEEFREHVDVLQAMDAVYRSYFWPDHKALCTRVLEENLPLIEATEKTYVDRITLLSRQYWQEDKIRVDITFVAKATDWNFRNRPYSTIFPAHVVMNALGENDVKGNWLELLYHESAHHLILTRSYFVGGTIRDLAEVMEIRPPRELGHAYLFYFTGQLTKDLLAQHDISYPATYMERNGVFSIYHPLLQKHLTPYMNRETTLGEATRQILIELQ